MDIFINGTNLQDGISNYQSGSDNSTIPNPVPAGNTFTQNSVIMHVDNQTQQYLAYYYSMPNQQLEKPININNVGNLGVNNANSCPTRIGLFTREEALLVYGQINTQTQTLLYNYNQLIDDGNTEMLLLEIQGNWSFDVWKLREELMGRSPYLSQELLKEIVENNLLPKAIFLEIALKNVDATRDHGFLDFLREKEFPEYMVSLIEANWKTKSLRTLLEEQLSVYSMERDYLLNTLLGYYLEDKIDYSLVNNLLLSRGYYSDYFTITEILIQENDFYNAYNIIAQVEQDYPKNKFLLEEVGSYTTYISLREKYHLSKKSIYELDEKDVNELITFALSGSGNAHNLAHNLLCALYDICLKDLTPKSTEQSNKSYADRDISANSLQHVKVMPNPAQLYTIFEWDFDSFIYDATLVIYDIFGKPLARRSIHEPKGQWVWNTSTIPNGAYPFAIMDGIHIVESGKVIIQK